MREREINQLPPLDRFKAEGNEFFKNSKFPDAIKAVRAAPSVSFLVHEGY